ncbi:MAG: hypothetical protein K2G30_07215 [Muribaculaceae bacterium]|nr:hypothetical protein [Muribaculaceae bacterium]
MRLVEKILSVTGIVLLGMSLGVGLCAARERCVEARAKRKEETRAKKAEARAKKEAEAAAVALIAEKARRRVERRKAAKK